MADARGKLIGYEEISKGELTQTTVTPRQVFTPALLANAASVFVAHNHPSGDPTPSVDDTGLTMRLKDAGKLLGVKLVDHVIIAAGDEGKYYSYCGEGFNF